MTRTTAAVFAAALLLNVSIRSVFFNFDGVACAVAVELSDFKHLVHGNHLAYGVVAWLFDKLWRLFGYQGRSLLVLQTLDSILGAAGAAAFASLLRRSGRGEREAVLGAAALAVCHAWWFWSLEAQVYMLGAFFIVLSAREALSDKPRAKAIGLWHGLAILGHVGHAMAFPALVYALVRKKDRKPLAPYAMTTASVVVLAYLLAAVFAMQPTSFEDVRVWLLGSAALSVDKSFGWHSVPLGHAVTSWLGMSLRIFTEFVGRRGAYWSLGFILAVLPWLAAIRATVDKTRESRFWLLWLLGYAALFILWEPYTIVYRVTDLVPLLALATLGLQSFPPRWRSGVLVAWTLAASLYNYSFVIKPASDAGNNLDLMDAQWTTDNTPDNAWILASNRGAVYIPYFSARKPVNLRYFAPPGALEARLDALAASGDTVFVSGRTLEDRELLARLQRYGLQPTVRVADLSMFRVLRLK